MSRFGELLRDAWRVDPRDPQPWYRKRTLWLLATALVLPFGWVVPLCCLAWVQASDRRTRRF